MLAKDWKLRKPSYDFIIAGSGYVAIQPDDETFQQSAWPRVLNAVAAGDDEPAPVRFLETEARFPAATNLRQDRGNNGYCVLQLNADGSMGLEYWDWMSRKRFAAALTRGAAGTPLVVTTV